MEGLSRRETVILEVLSLLSNGNDEDADFAFTMRGYWGNESVTIPYEDRLRLIETNIRRYIKSEKEEKVLKKLSEYEEGNSKQRKIASLLRKTIDDIEDGYSYEEKLLFAEHILNKYETAAR